MVSAGESVKYQVAGNDATTVFETGLAAQAVQEVEVWLDAAVQTLGIDYTATITAGLAIITMGTAPANGETLTVIRKTAISQALDLTFNDRLPSIAIEQRLDTIVRAIRDLDARQVIRFPDIEAIDSNQTLSAAADRAGKLIYFNATTGELEEIGAEELNDAFQLVAVGPTGPAGPTGPEGPTGATETTETILDKLKGPSVADSTKIGPEYMPELIPVDGVTLADTSAVELPARTLGMNADGRVVIHDGDTTGGVDIEGMILRGTVIHTVTDAIAADQIVDIASLVIPADCFTSGQQFFLIGTVTVKSALTGYEPAGNPSLIVYLCDSAGNRNATAEPDDGYRLPLSTAAAPAAYTIIEIFENWSASVSTTLGLSLPGVTGSTRMRTLAAGVATETEKLWANSGLAGERSVNYGGVGGFAYLKIALLLTADAATANASGTITAACDLRLMK